MERRSAKDHTSLVPAAVAVAVSLLLPAPALARIPEPAAWQPIPLRLRLLQAGELGDLSPVAPPRSLAAGGFWLGVGTGAHFSIQTRPSGVVGGLDEHLASPRNHVQAVSVVVEFASPATASAQVVAWRTRSFARVFSPATRITLGTFGANTLGVVFADGDFAYLIAERWSHASATHSSRADLLQAAVRLDERVHAHPAPAY